MLYCIIGNVVFADVQPLLRFPRFIKIYRLVQFLYLAENQATYPNVLRVCNLTHILLLLCHWFAAFYYMISKVRVLFMTQKYQYLINLSYLINWWMARISIQILENLIFWLSLKYKSEKNLHVYQDGFFCKTHLNSKLMDEFHYTCIFSEIRGCVWIDRKSVV